MGPAKLEKATKLNISILSEDDFINMLMKTNMHNRFFLQ
jgi:BRCT domain type II-containing protein